MAIVHFQSLSTPVLKHSGHQKQGFPRRRKICNKEPKVIFKETESQF